MDQQACCAHSRVILKHNEHDDGTRSDFWECADGCGTKFWPERMTNEIRIMQLAAISTASIQNTESTVKERIGRENPYWSQAYEDVCVAVNREMAHRKSLQATREMISRFLVAHRDTSKNWIEAFVECGAIEADFNYHPLYPFIKPKQ